MKKVLVITISLFLSVSSCNEISKSQYKSVALQKFDLRGDVKSIETNAFFGDMSDLCNFCNSDISYLDIANVKIINFSTDGNIKLIKSKNRVEIYDETGKIIRTSFRNDKGDEYGYSNFTYYPNTYYKVNRYYEIDSTRLFIDTVMRVETGTRDKYYKGPDFLSVAIHRTNVLDKNNYILEEMYLDIQSSVYKYKYDTLGRLTSKTETYQDYKIDSISFEYNKEGNLISCTNKFEFRKFDNYGNWQKLIIKNKDKEIEIIRKINYY